MKPNLSLSLLCIALLLFSFVACISKTPGLYEPTQTQTPAVNKGSAPSAGSTTLPYTQ